MSITDTHETRTRVRAIGPLGPSAPKAGLSASIISLLRTRRLHVPEDVSRRIESSTDTSLLDRWLVRASTVDLAEDIFTD